MSNPNPGIDHHDEAQEDILFPSVDPEADIDSEPDDFSSDAEALASAGHGMDEDYGGNFDGGYDE